MKSEKIRLGILGTGPAAQAHIEAVLTIQGAKLTALAGRTYAKAKALGEKFRLSFCYEDAQTLLQSAEVDAVILAVPPSEIAVLAVSAFAHGKHVLCEKLLGIGVSQAESIVAAWRKSHRVGMINFSYRLIPEFQEFKTRLDAGECGQLNLINAQWVLPNRLDQNLTYHWKGQRELGGGVLQNYGVHILDYLFWDSGDVRILGAYQKTVGLQRPDASGEIRDITGDEVTTALFLLKSVPVFVHFSLATRPGIGLKLVAQGTGGSIELSNENILSPAGPFKLVLSGEDAKRVPGMGHRFGMKDLFRHTIQSFVNAITENRPIEPLLESGLKVARFVEEIQKKAASNPHFPTP